MSRSTRKQPAARQIDDARKAPDPSRLDISVLTMSRGDPLDLSRELALSKAALLYGDDVTLIGPKVTLLSYVDRLQSGSREERNALLLQMLRAYPGGRDALMQLDTVSAGGPRQRRAVELLKAKMLAQARGQIEAAIAPVLEETHFAEFARALRAGRLKLDPLTPDGRPPSRKVVGDALASTITAATHTASGAPDPMVEAFKERLIGTILGASTALPLLDSDVRSLAQSMRDVLVAMGVTARPVPPDPAVAAGLLEALPSFPDAPMDEILDARRSLEPALVRFRAAIARVAAETPLDVIAQPIDAELATLWRRDVSPAFQELREFQEQLRLGRQLTRHAIDSGKSISKPVLGLLLASSIHMDELVKTFAALLPTALDIAARVAAERRRLERERRVNPFVFLYDVERRLS